MDNNKDFENGMYYDPNAFIMPWRKTAKKEDITQKYNYADLPNYATGRKDNAQPANANYPNSYDDLSKTYNIAQEVPKQNEQTNQPNMMSGLSNLFGGGLGNLLSSGGLGNILGMLGGNNGSGLSNILSSLGGEGGGLENIMKMLGGGGLKNILGGNGGLSNIMKLFSKNKQTNTTESGPKVDIDKYEKVED